MPDSILLDPLNRRITMHDRTWFGHIIKGHPDVSAYRQEVEEIVRSPNEIRFSNASAECRLYLGDAPAHGLLLTVVADVSLGIVKTAYVARKSSGGGIEWSKPTQ